MWHARALIGSRLFLNGLACADAGEDEGHVASCSSRRCIFVTKVDGGSRPGFRCPFPQSVLKILSTHSSSRCRELCACVCVYVCACVCVKRYTPPKPLPNPPSSGSITHVFVAVIPRTARGSHPRTDAAPTNATSRADCTACGPWILSHVGVRRLSRVRVRLGNQTACYSSASDFTHDCAAQRHHHLRLVEKYRCLSLPHNNTYWYAFVFLAGLFTAKERGNMFSYEMTIFRDES